MLATIIWAWATMETAYALIFTAYMVPVALLDNFLKPIVMAQGLPTPMLVIFVGVLGGALAHGLIGLFVGRSFWRSPTSCCCCGFRAKRRRTPFRRAGMQR